MAAATATSAAVPSKSDGSSAMADFVLFDEDPIYQDYRPPAFLPASQSPFEHNHHNHHHSHYTSSSVSRSHVTDVDSYVAMLGDQTMDELHSNQETAKPYYHHQISDLPPEAVTSSPSFDAYPAYTYPDGLPLSMAAYDAPAPGVLIHPPTMPYSPHTSGHMVRLGDYRTPISPATSAGGLEGHSSAGSEAGSIGSPYPPSHIGVDDPFNPAYVDPSLISIPSPSQPLDDPLSAGSSRGSPSWHSPHSPPPSSPEFGKRTAGRLSPRVSYRSAPYPNPGSRRLSVSSQSSLRSHGSPNAYPVELDEVYREVPRAKGTSSNGSGSGNTSTAAVPTSGKDSLCQECKKSFRDLKAHQLTHQLERPVKCPIATCEYSKKGFARKYDCQRHTLTHYKGTMVCGFCPGSGSAAEKSFNRADVFKRHLMSVHHVEQNPPNSRKRPTPAAIVNPGDSRGSSSSSSSRQGSDVERFSGTYITGKCSTCSITFATAQQFYEHLDECVLSKVVEEEPAAAFNEMNLGSVKIEDVENILAAKPGGGRANNRRSQDEEEPTEEEEAEDEDEELDAEDDAKDATFTIPSKSAAGGGSSTRLTRSKKGSAAQR